MSATEIPADERGVVRIYRIDLPDAEIERFASPEPAPDVYSDDDTPVPTLLDALGAEVLDWDHVDVFPVSNLAAIGLSAYLIEGLGVPLDDIEGARARIDAVEGHVLVLSSQAFAGKAQRIDPRPPLRPVGTFREPPPKPVIGPIETEGGKGRLARRRQARVVHHTPSALRTGLIVLLAVLIGAGIVFFLATSMS